MKVILQDKGIVVRVVLESESDYDYHNERGEGFTVANDFSVTAGNYVDITASPVTVREATINDFTNGHGCIRVIPASILKPYIVGLDTTQETEESLEAISSMANADVDVSDSDCFVHSLTDNVKNDIYRAFGFIDFNEVYNRNPQYHLQPEETTTTTTTEAPAE